MFISFMPASILDQPDKPQNRTARSSLHPGRYNKEVFNGGNLEYQNQAPRYRRILSPPKEQEE